MVRRRVGVDGQLPLVEVFSPVVWGIAESPALLRAVNEINTRIRFGRLVWTGREVMASTQLSAARMSADDVGFDGLPIGSIADRLDDELRERFGCKVMFEPGRELLN